MLNLENGKTFTINVKNQGDKNVYVQKIILNGQPLNGYFISHSDIMNGGEITFVMGSLHKIKINLSNHCETFVPLRRILYHSAVLRRYH